VSGGDQFFRIGANPFFKTGFVGILGFIKGAALCAKGALSVLAGLL